MNFLMYLPRLVVKEIDMDIFLVLAIIFVSLSIIGSWIGMFYHGHPLFDRFLWFVTITCVIGIVFVLLSVLNW